MAPKKKQEKMSLGDFLGNQTLGSWADEMEDAPITAPERRAFSSASTFGAPREGAPPTDRYAGFARADPRPQLPLPSRPPYTAHLGNLPFDATNGDIEDFFAGCEVSNVRIVEDKLDRKPKGFGYVEFRSLDGLKKALDLSETQFMGRNIRISVADPPKDRPEQRELNDWTRKGPLPDLPNQQRRASDRGGFGSGYEAAPPMMERGGSRRGFNPEGDGKVRDFSNWERKGPLSPALGASGGPGAPGAPPAGREGRPRGEPRERRLSPAWGEGRSDAGSRPPQGDRRPPVDRQPTAAEMDNKWRDRMLPDAPVKSSSPTPDPSAPSSPSAPAAPAGRPRLNLAKRTVSEAQPSAATESSDSKASPFGAARPIDTAAREREVAEKRELAIRQKRAADEKAREEKKAKEAAAKAAEEAGGDSTEGAKANGENGENDGAPQRNVQILSRTGEEGDPEKEGEDADANGEIVDDKAVKPREFTRTPPTGPKADRPQGGSGGGGEWRRKSSAAAAPDSPKPESTAEVLEEDGWSTVPSKQRGGKGRGGARAVAS